MTISFHQLAFDRLTLAKKRFGEYTYHDKGAHEVMDIDELVQELRKLSDEEAIEELLLLSEEDDTFLLVSGILQSVEDWDALFENETLADHY